MYARSDSADLVARDELNAGRVRRVQIFDLTRTGDVMRAADNGLHPPQTRVARRTDLSNVMFL